MAARTDPHGSRRFGSVVLLGLAGLALVAVIGVASRGAPWHVEARSGPSRIPADTIGTVAFVLIGALGLGAIVMVLLGRKIVGTGTRRQRSWWEQLVLTMLLIAAFAVIVRRHPIKAPLRPAAPTTATRRVPASPRRSASPVRRNDEWRSVVLVIAVLVLAGAATVRARSGFAHRAPQGLDVDVDAGVGAAIDVAIEASLADPDPRRAIVAAFAALETAIARAGQPRHPAETAVEYVARVLRTVAVDRDPIERLRERYLIARFSDQPMAATDRSGALRDLRAIRSGLA